MMQLPPEELALFNARAAADGDTGLAYEARLLIRQLSRRGGTATPRDALRIDRIRYKAFKRYARRRRAAHQGAA